MCPDLRLCGGASDGNRTRVSSLGRALAVLFWLLTCSIRLPRMPAWDRAQPEPWARSGHAVGMARESHRTDSGAGQCAAVAGSRVAAGHRVSDAEGALDAVRRRADSEASGRRLGGPWGEGGPEPVAFTHASLGYAVAVSRRDRGSRSLAARGPAARPLASGAPRLEACLYEQRRAELRGRRSRFRCGAALARRPRSYCSGVVAAPGSRGQEQYSATRCGVGVFVRVFCAEAEGSVCAAFEPGEGKERGRYRQDGRNVADER